MAKFFQRPPDREGFNLKDLPIPFLLLMVPMGFILKQPDLGTAIILFLILFSVLLFVKDSLVLAAHPRFDRSIDPSSPLGFLEGVSEEADLHLF